MDDKMFKVGDKVKVKNPDLTEQDELLSIETIAVLKALNFTGAITQIEDDLYFVGFAHDKLGWVTQVFKADEIEGVK